MTACSLKSCSSPVTAKTGRVEVRGFKVTEKERKVLKVRNLHVRVKFKY